MRKSLAVPLLASMIDFNVMREPIYYNHGSPIFIPRKGKFKGYMRENRKCTFNKNK